MPCGNAANSITAKLLPEKFLHEGTCFLCSTICEEKSRTVVQDTTKFALVIRSGLEESRLSEVDD